MKFLRHIGWVWVLALGWCNSLLAQQPKVLPDVTSTEGREFYVAWLPNGGSEASSTDLKLLLYANARHATNIIVEFANGATQTYPIVENSTHGASATIVIDPFSIRVRLPERKEVQLRHHWLLLLKYPRKMMS